MDLKAVVGALSEIERKTLAELSAKESPLEEVSRVSGLNIDSVRRAVNWLEQKGLAQIYQTKTTKPELTEEGKNALNKGLPEVRMLNALLKKELMSFDEIMKEEGFWEKEFNVALGLNKRKAYVLIAKKDKPMVQLTGVSKDFESEEQKAIEQIAEGQKPKNENEKLLISKNFSG